VAGAAQNFLIDILVVLLLGSCGASKTSIAAGAGRKNVNSPPPPPEKK
jgi:hypothetical protein